MKPMEMPVMEEGGGYPALPAPTCDSTVVPVQIPEYTIERPVKPGEIMSIRSDQLPIGYLWCNGVRVSRIAYRVLFNAIGVQYGEGDGALTFNVPNLTDDADPTKRFIIKYNNYIEPTGQGTFSWIDNSITAYSGTGEILFIPYPTTFSPIPGTILYNTVNYLPAGYLCCDGSEVSRLEYDTLYHIIGTFYGTGDGSTTFNVPNLTISTVPYRYIIRFAVPDTMLVQINPNMEVSSMKLSDMAEINIM
jgi:microcystin-dependent protein